MSTICARCGNEIDLADLERAEETIYRIEEYLEALEFGALIGDNAMSVSEALPRITRKIRLLIHTSTGKARDET